MIHLTSDETACTIDPEGAWVTSLQCGETPVFFPRTEVSYGDLTKQRGGMHVCVPNFGPDRDGRLAQHGFGRTSTWTVTEQGDASVTLRLRGGDDDYADLESSLTYALSERSFSATLRCKNRGSSLLRLAPGFHPYFHVAAKTKEVSLNTVPYQLAALAGTEFLEAEALTLQINDRAVHLTQSNLPTWAIWTDQQRNYVCCEPTHGGNRFLSDSRDDEIIQPDHERLYTISIKW